MKEERCPCRRHRLLAEYDGGPTIHRLAPKASITMVFPLPAGMTTGPAEGGPLTGSARCVKLSCRLLRRN